MRTQYLSLVAMSVFCFSAILFPVWDQVPGFLVNTTGLEQLYCLADTSFFAVVSLCGGIAFLLATKNENPSWHLGIPLCIMFALIAVSPLVSGILVISDPEPPIYHPGILWILLSEAAVCLIPPGAALFFWSQRAPGKLVPVLSGIALAVTLFSLGMLWAEISPYLVSAGLLPPAPPELVNGLPVRSENDGFLILTLMFGLPLIGILFLLLAGMSWYTSLRAVPEPPRSPGTRS